MRKYSYLAKDAGGNIFSGTMTAESEEALRSDLAKIQYNVVHVVEERKPAFSLFQRGVRGSDLITFTRQLAAMYKAGINIEMALDVLEKQSSKIALKEVIRGLKDWIQSGLSFHESLRKYPKVFSDFYVSMVEAGESSGTVGNVLDRLAVYLEKSENLRQKITSACVYPAVVLSLGAVVTGFLITFVVPVYASVFKSMGSRVSLPWPTLTLMFASNFLQKYACLLTISLVVIVLLRGRIRKLGVMINILEYVKTKSPLIGQLNQRVAEARFIRTLGVMLENGVPLLTSLETAEKVAGSRRISDAAKELSASVNAGGSFAEPMNGQQVFQPIVVCMAAVGEESGNLGQMLLESADFLDRDLDVATKRLLSLLEPVATVVLAAIVGFILLSLYLPMFDILKIIKSN